MSAFSDIACRYSQIVYYSETKLTTKPAGQFLETQLIKETTENPNKTVGTITMMQAALVPTRSENAERCSANSVARGWISEENVAAAERTARR
jgi:hypothetical protein